MRKSRASCAATRQSHRSAFHPHLQTCLRGGCGGHVCEPPRAHAKVRCLRQPRWCRFDLHRESPAAHAVVWRSRALSGGPVPLLWLHDQLLLVTVLVQRCANHFSTLACHHMIMLSLSPTPPLNHCLRPDFPLTFDPPDRILWLCGRMETWLDPFLAFSWSLTRWVHPSAAQRALSRIDFACTVCDACSTARVRASSGEYYSIVLSVMVDLDASLMFNTCENAPPVLERRPGRLEVTELTRRQIKRLASIRIKLV